MTNSTELKQGSSLPWITYWVILIFQTYDFSSNWPWLRSRASAVNSGTLNISAVSTSNWSLASCKSWALNPLYSCKHVIKSNKFQVDSEAFLKKIENIFWQSWLRYTLSSDDFRSIIQQLHGEKTRKLMITYGTCFMKLWNVFIPLSQLLTAHPQSHPHYQHSVTTTKSSANVLSKNRYIKQMNVLFFSLATKQYFCRTYREDHLGLQIQGNLGMPSLLCTITRCLSVLVLHKQGSTSLHQFLQDHNKSIPDG